jgi:uncharacterized protein (TIGR03435 family)
MPCEVAMRSLLPCCVLVFQLVSPAGLQAQRDGAPTAPGQFDVASVKRVNEGNAPPRLGSGTPGRFNANNVTLRDLISAAYGTTVPFDPARIVGGPDWIDKERFEINATLPVNATRAELPWQQSLRALLQDRFALRIHMERREAPVFALVRVDNARAARALRRPARSLADCHAAEDNPFGDSTAGVCPRLRNRPGADPADPLAVVTEARTIVMRALAEELSGMPIVGRLVVDETGVSGEFDFEFRWSRPAPPSADSPAPVGQQIGPSIFTALREQLGLALQARKGQADVLVIDHADRLVEN